MIQNILSTSIGEPKADKTLPAGTEHRQLEGWLRSDRHEVCLRRPVRHSLSGGGSVSAKVGTQSMKPGEES